MGFPDMMRLNTGDGLVMTPVNVKEHNAFIGIKPRLPMFAWALSWRNQVRRILTPPHVHHETSSRLSTVPWTQDFNRDGVVPLPLYVFCVCLWNLTLLTEDNIDKLANVEVNVHGANRYCVLGVE